jgi:hypothetical protein
MPSEKWEKIAARLETKNNDGKAHERVTRQEQCREGGQLAVPKEEKAMTRGSLRYAEGRFAPGRGRVLSRGDGKPTRSPRQRKRMPGAWRGFAGGGCAGQPMNIEINGRWAALTRDDSPSINDIAGAGFGFYRWPEEQNEFAIFARDFRRFEGQTAAPTFY